LKPNLYLKYKDKHGEWHNASIISKVKKVGGTHDGWFNVETKTGMKRAINCSNIKDIEVDDDLLEVTLIPTQLKFLQQNRKSCSHGRISQYILKTQAEVKMSLKWVGTPNVIDLDLQSKHD